MSSKNVQAQFVWKNNKSKLIPLTTRQEHDDSALCEGEEDEDGTSVEVVKT